MSRKFYYTDFDDIETSYYKTTWLSVEMLLEILKNPVKYINGVSQEGEPRYFPTRKPEDGGIDWNLKKIDIYNFVRALTHPYPGAFTYYQDIKINIYRAIPFEIPMKIDEFSIGEVCVVFDSTKNFVVRCLDGFILVREWKSDKEWIPQEKMIFKSIDFKEQMKIIVDRWYKNNPELKVNDKILELCNEKKEIIK
jgi:methionyl-tRNA formyltransferase